MEEIKCYLRTNELINAEGAEYLASIDLQSCSTRIDVKEEAGELEEQGLVKVIPYQEELYDYGREMYNFLENRGINVPKGEKAIRYLQDIGLQSAFWQEVDEVIQSNFQKWLKRNGFKLITVTK